MTLNCKILSYLKPFFLVLWFHSIGLIAAASSMPNTSNSNWEYDDVFGWRIELSNGWTYHYEHRFIFSTQTENEDGFYFYDTKLGSWFWYSENVYPFLYSLEMNDWIYYFKGGKPGSRYFHQNVPNRIMDESEFAAVLDQPEIDLVDVAGGVLPPLSDLGFLDVESFRIGKYELTWGECQKVIQWADLNGYDLSGYTLFDDADLLGPTGCKENHPAGTMNLSNGMKFCNALSELHGLTPVYKVGPFVHRTLHPVVIPGDDYLMSIGINEDPNANGYRLPHDDEWEFAARGGRKSRGYFFSGSDNPDTVAIYYKTSAESQCPVNGGRGTYPVGSKEANELGIFDMTGNVSELIGGWEWRRPTEISDFSPFGTGRRGGNFWSGFHSAFPIPDLSTRSNTWIDTGASVMVESGYGLRIAQNFNPQLLVGKLAFGRVEVGASETLRIKLKNSGNTEVNIDSILVPEGYSAEWNSIKVPPGKSTLVSITFTPESEDFYLGELEVFMGGSGSNVLRKELSGSGYRPNSSKFSKVTAGTVAYIRGSSKYEVHLDDFFISKFEVTVNDWTVITDWAVERGYDFFGYGSGGDYPVFPFDIFDAFKFCNAASEAEGLEPVYHTESGTFRSGSPSAKNPFKIYVYDSQNGYRIPSYAQWYWAYSDRTSTPDSPLPSWETYTAGHPFAEYAWYTENSQNPSIVYSHNKGLFPVGQKASNKMGLHDMVGNVSEYCINSFAISQAGELHYSGNDDSPNNSYGVMSVGGSFVSSLPFDIIYRNLGLTEAGIPIPEPVTGMRLLKPGSSD